MRLTREQVRMIDRMSIEEYQIPGVVLMENAARAVADNACDMMHGDCVGEVLILCGGGNNGGDGLATARHLHNRGADVSIFLLNENPVYKNEALVNWEIARAMKLEIGQMDLKRIVSDPTTLIIDAIFGTGLSRAPDGKFAEIVAAVKHSKAPVLAVDVPSGMDCDSGKALGACVHAHRTVTFVAEKVGFGKPGAAAYLGEVVVADIGCPREVVERVRNGGSQ